MNRKIARWTIGLLALSLAAGLLWAQEETDGPATTQEAGKVMRFDFAMEGQGRLGVGIADVDTAKAQELKLPGEYGAWVTRVEEGSAAAKAGIAKNDVILEFGGEKVHSAAQLRRLVRETPPGRNVTLAVSRAGQSRTVALKLEKGERHFAFAPGMEGPGPVLAGPEMRRFEFKLPDQDFVWFAGGSRLGISGDELTSQLAEFFGVKQGKGVLVREVVVGSAADKAGLKAGDVIVRVDDDEVGSIPSLRRALGHDRNETRTVKLTVVRDRKEMTVSAQLDPARPPSPRQMTENLGFGDPEEARAFAEAMREQAEEIQAEAKKAAESWQNEQGQFREEQKQLQEELQRLHEEGRELNNQIKEKIRMETGSVESEV